MSAAPTIPGVIDLVEVGRGGFAIVYRGEQAAFRRQVAAKVLTIELDDRARLRFERECQALGSLSDHPGIVTVYSAGTTGEGRPYLLMPYLPGGSYDDRLRSGALPWAEVLDLGVQLCDALAAAHAEGVLHRDLKPANVLVSRHARPVLADFGIARVAGSLHTSSSTGQVTGSVHYLAPEVIEGGPPSVASDVYALGGTLLALLAGRPPFYREDDHGVVPVIHRIMTASPDRPDGVPGPIVDALLAAMAKDPADRPDGAAALGRRLQDVQGQLGLPVTPLEVPSPGAADGPAAGSPPLVGSRLPGSGDVGPAPVGSDEWVGSRLPGSADLPPVGSTTVVGDPLPLLGAPPPAAVGGRRGRAAVVGVAVAAVLVGGVVAAFLLLRGGGPAPIRLADVPTAPGDGEPYEVVERGALPAGRALDGDLAAGTADLYVLAAPAGSVIRARALAQDDDDDLVAGVVSADGRVLTTDDDSGGGRTGRDPLAEVLAPDGGSVGVVVAGYSASDAEGRYRVVADVLVPQVLDGDVRATLTAGGAVAYRVEGTADDGTVTVAARSPEMDLYIRVLSPDGVVAEDDDSGGGGDALLHLDGLGPGPHVVLVTARDPSSAGPFDVEVRRG